MKTFKEYFDKEEIVEEFEDISGEYTSIYINIGSKNPPNILTYQQTKLNVKDNNVNYIIKGENRFDFIVDKKSIKNIEKGVITLKDKTIIKLT